MGQAVELLTYSIVNPLTGLLVNLTTHHLIISFNIPQPLSLLFQGRKPFP